MLVQCLNTGETENAQNCLIFERKYDTFTLGQRKTERRWSFMRLSDTIEAFIKEMMQEEQMEVQIKRNELAEYFHCAPSQINYVLATRFTPDHGYVTSSQRGGGGYIRIVQVQRGAQDQLSYLLNERIGDSIDSQSALILCRQLVQAGIATLNEGDLMAAAVAPSAFSVPVPEQVKDALRAKVMRSMLLSLAQKRKEGR